MLQAHRDELTVDALRSPVTSFGAVSCLTCRSAFGHGPHNAQQQEAIVLITEADEDDNNTNRVTYIRGSHMVVREEVVASLPMGSRNFHAVVLVGLAAGDEPADKAADRFLRAAEPPAHDNWEVTPTSRVPPLAATERH